MNPESRRKAGLWLGLVFVLGLATGGVFGYSFAHRSYASTKTIPLALSEPERRAKRIADMTKELGLTPDQATNVDTVIHKAHDNMKAIHDKADADMKAIHDKADADSDSVRQNARAQIREMLTPEQRPKYEAMLARMDEGRKKQAAAAGAAGK
jgi:Spy/CpxP family protein refolding chaperone